ncbi:hypothetical protein [Georgenia yuyongxinii]|uniref:Uncharacterized protein n=1 Tax=Georgenia yuyongxinii TaxID=2589797 RepID=A0A552WXC6_9MICO|nr:hypothetical protein [Georgenia yuyongxinii]TRW46973.1 hypothetical protein FJ693_03045 [Georgenia yuyongxinii]
MTLSEVHPRPAVASRRVGYVLAAMIDAALLYAVNAWPGWDAVPFLTPDTAAVLGPVNASLLVGLVANAVYVVHDAWPVRALGDLATTSVGLVALVRLWQVFPFDFGAAASSWDLVARVLLALGILGSVVAIVVALVRLVRGPARRR